MNSIIKTVNLSKAYSKNVAVNNLNLNIGKGEIFGFLGSNGAGKTTTIRMLTTVISPSQGSAMVAGYCVKSQALSVRKKNYCYSSG